MAAEPDDPFATMSFTQRAGLKRRLKRAWREGIAQQRATALLRLRLQVTGVPLLSADYHGMIGELAWSDGTVARLWLCHRPAVKALRLAAREGVAVLVQADDHGHCWALYFATLEGRLPLLCRDLRVRDSQGGPSHPVAVPAPLSG
jgi:hypothetical protein